MTLATYYTLMELLLENVSSNRIQNPLTAASPASVSVSMSPSPSESASGVGGVPQFRNSDIIGTIFELVCLSADADLQIQLLNDFSYLLKVSQASRYLLHPPSMLLFLLASS